MSKDQSVHVYITVLAPPDAFPLGMRHVRMDHELSLTTGKDPLRALNKHQLDKKCN